MPKVEAPYGWLCFWEFKFTALCSTAELKVRWKRVSICHSVSSYCFSSACTNLPPPRWLTSTDPPLPWDDTSPKPRYLFQGECTSSTLHKTTGLSILSFVHAACVVYLRTFIYIFIYLLAPQGQHSHCWLPSDISHAWRAARSTEKIHFEQADGVQRVQTVSIRPGAAQFWVTVHWSTFPKHGLKTGQKEDRRSLFSLLFKLDHSQH